jgi:hypothetical protein
VVPVGILIEREGRYGRDDMTAIELNLGLHINVTGRYGYRCHGAMRLGFSSFSG